jgi:hypothetical protein
VVELGVDELDELGAAAGAAAGAAGAVVDDGLSDLDSALLVSLEEEDSEAGSLLLAA